MYKFDSSFLITGGTGHIAKSRQKDADDALYLALQIHFPTTFKNLISKKLIKRKRIVLTGKIIKLYRIALNHLAKII